MADKKYEINNFELQYIKESLAYKIGKITKEMVYRNCAVKEDEKTLSKD